MKFLRTKESGSVLMITMVIIGIVGIALASYLSMAGAMNKSVTRSQTWNSAIPIVEAGIEEAIVHLNKNCLASDITQTTPNWTADSWTAVAGGLQLTRTLGTSRYTVTILTAAPYTAIAPAIVSEGYVPAPLASLEPQTMFAVIGSVNPNQAFVTNKYVGRKVRVTTGLDGIFIKGMVAKDSIDLRGNRISTDSFDSADPAHSSSGQYNILTRKDNGDVAVNSMLMDSFNVGNADIRGKASTGPGGLVSIGPNGTIGDAPWNDSGVNGIQPGHTADDMNVSFQDVLVPFTSGYSTPTGGSVTNLIIVPPGALVTTTNLPTNAVSVVTNLVVANSTNYPDPNTFVGSVQTNQYPVVTTNTGPTSSTSYPTNAIGSITTNSASVTTNVAPVAGTYLGNVTTNTVSTNTVAAPVVGTYLGNVTTNTVSTNTVAAPAAGTYLGSVTTNSASTNTVAPPAAGTYTGSVTTNTVSTTTAGVPASGTYLGSVTTNTVSTTTVAVPSSGTYVGALTTNTTSTTVLGWNNRPANGTFTTITTNSAGTQHTGAGNPPASGSYFPGSLVVTLGTNGQINGYDYLQISGYTYAKITGYTYAKITTYTYAAISTYTSTQTSSYTYAVITSYTYAKISTYTYIKITSYGYTAVSGYTTNYATSGYTYNRKKDYTYQTSVATTNTVVTAYDYILYDGDYKLSNLTGSVLVLGKARLYVTDNINITGQNAITIDPYKSLKLYSGAPSVSIAGNGVINNGGNATNFYYFGLPSNTDLKLAGNSAFTGVIYAPEANYKLGGGGNDTYDFIGASVTKTVVMNGHYNFHYDENLGRVASSRGYVIRSWNEIPLH